MREPSTLAFDANDPEGAALVEAVLSAALDDWLMALTVLSIVRSHFPDARGDEPRRISLAVIETTLRQGWLSAGDIGEGFVSWGLSPEQAFARIALSWPPSRQVALGEVCWLEITEKGAARLMAGRQESARA